LIAAFENVDLLIAQYVYTSAIEDYIAVGGGSRGSYIIPDDNGTCHVPDMFNFTPDNGKSSSIIQEISYSPKGCETSWHAVRPIPRNNDPFESVWRDYREDAVIRNDKN